LFKKHYAEAYLGRRTTQRNVRMSFVNVIKQILFIAKKDSKEEHIL